MDDWNKFSGNTQESGQTDRFEQYRNVSSPSPEPSAAKPARKEKFVTRKVFVVTLIFAMIFSAVIGAGAFALTAHLTGNSVVTKNTNNINLVKATGSELSIQEIVAKNEDSVVAITTESVSTDSWARQYVTNGAGSGVVYSEDGYILTNNHVIEGASSITVTLHDNSTYDATVVAADSQTDVAVLKINASGLTPVTLGDSDSLSVGDLAVVIGNPLGTLAGTATEGIISGLEREITLDGKAMTLLQTSASVNPGNSGGGVFDQYGNLIGLVVAKSSGSDVEGLGFAIPVNTVKAVADSLIKDGYVTGRPALGITIVDLTSASEAMKYGVKVTGVYIKDVTGESAKSAGLQSGDLIYMIDGSQVKSSDMLIREVQKHKVGDTVTLTIVRDDEIKDIEITLQQSKSN